MGHPPAITTESESKPDPYNIEVVRNALMMRSGERVVIHSWNQKHLMRMGDGVSIAILKTLDLQQLKEPKTVRDLLPIIRDAFYQPKFVAIESDRKPTITLFVLQFFRDAVSDLQTRQDIDQTMEFVKKQTSISN